MSAKFVSSLLALKLKSVNLAVYAYADYPHLGGDETLLVMATGSFPHKAISGMFDVPENEENFSLRQEYKVLRFLKPHR